jgi:hypothetical protein
MAKERAQTAVVDLLAPICVERFQQQADAPAKLTEFNKASSWDRRLIIEKGGWQQRREPILLIRQLLPPAQNGLRARYRSRARPNAQRVQINS